MLIISRLVVGLCSCFVEPALTDVADPFYHIVVTVV